MRVYVAGYESGLVKIGFSSFPSRRRRELEQKNAIRDWWVSGEVGGPQFESKCQKAVIEHGASIHCGRETFSGISFSEAVSVSIGVIEALHDVARRSAALAIKRAV